MKKSLLILLTFCIVMLIGSPTEQAESEPEPVSYDVPNINYDTNHSECVMDIYRSADEVRPVVMLIHGGAWITVQINGASMDAALGLDRVHMVKFKDFFLENGYHVVNIEYRRINILSPDGTKYTDMLDDVKSAVTFLNNNANYYKIDTSKLVMLGYSAGGHLAELYSYKITDSPIPVKLCIGRAGPADFSNEKFRTCSLGGFAEYPGLAAMFGLPNNITKTELENFFRCRLITNLLGIETDVTSDINKIADDPNNQNDIQEASPIYYVNANSPRTIILHGKNDPLVDYSIAESLDAKLTEYDVTHDFITLPNANHDLNMTPSELENYNSKVLQALQSL